MQLLDVLTLPSLGIISLINQLYEALRNLKFELKNIKFLIFILFYFFNEAPLLLYSFF